jgi:hypothetical protein
VNYRDRSGRTVANDANDGAWLKPAFQQMHRVLRPNSLCVSFYGWNKIDRFMEAWKAAGFTVVGHIVFRKRYASKARFLSYEHESAYLLAKGHPGLPAQPVPDVLDFPYSGNSFHPTQKPVQPLKTLIKCFHGAGADRPRPVLRLRLNPSGGAGNGPAVYRRRTRRGISPGGLRPPGRNKSGLTTLSKSASAHTVVLREKVIEKCGHCHNLIHAVRTGSIVCFPSIGQTRERADDSKAVRAFARSRLM